MKREEILQAFDDINFVYNDCTRYDTLKRMLEELTERKRGEWLYLYEDNYKCSICGLWWSCTDSQINEMTYCPNCGAKMKEVEE